MTHPQDARADLIAFVRSLRINRGTIRVLAVVVGTPLQSIADHVVQTPGVRLELADGRGVNKTIIPVECRQMGELPLGGLICRIGESTAVVGVVAPRVGGIGSPTASEFRPVGGDGRIRLRY
jgi:hypothetical protein